MRFHVPHPPPAGDFDLDGPEAHHLAHVRRAAVGDRVTLVCGDGFDYPADVTAVAKRHVALRVHPPVATNRELPFRLHVGCALPKGDRADFLIEKLTELGATDFTPLRTTRGVVSPGEAKADKLRRAVIEASKQCGRTVFMAVHAPADWPSWSRLPHAGRKLLAHPGGGSPAADAGRDGAAVAVGPEGGFTDDEIRQGMESGWDVIDLGPRILRVETAAVVLAVGVAMGR